MGKKASAIGSFFGGIANNPGIVVLGLVLGGLFIFRDKISDAIGGIELPSFEFPDITFPSFDFPDITFPSFEFPDFSGSLGDFQDVFATFQEQNLGFIADLQKQFDDFVTGGDIPQPQKMVEDTGLLPDPTICECGSSIVQDAFGNVNQQCKPCTQAVGPGFQGPPQPLGTPIPDRDIQDDIEGLTPAQSFGFIEKGIIPTGFEVVGGVLQKIMQAITPAIQPIVQPSPVQSFLIDEPTQEFGGGGPSFIGGSIFETPIANLSLSQIIDMFNVTASQASNILAIAQDDFGDFDFGTNTGLGIGSVIPGLPGIQESNVSDPQFQGLTPEQIFLNLVGGNIQNF